MLYEISDVDNPVLLPGADPVAAQGIVMQCLGSPNRPSPHVWPLPVDHERRYVLCSDGITNYATRVAMEECLASSADLADAATGILRAAVDGGCLDDATVIVVDVIPGRMQDGTSEDRSGLARHDDDLGDKVVIRE
jgi:serine/threonine protein phosphatase PrpC